jgi:glyoxylase-like metal-dependent hydrolase (beta-lactamase superfamily II)
MTIARWLIAGALGVGIMAFQRAQELPRPAAAKLTLEHIPSDSTAFNVLATVIAGPTEVVLWDAQYYLSDAVRVADRIAATKKRLKAIVLSHPDHDHFMGAAAVVERFPGTPVYMTAKGLAAYKRTAPNDFQSDKSRRPQLFPDSLVTPQVLPSLHLTVDGERLEVIPDLMGDVISGTNSGLWIPSLRTVLASDVVFDKVHVWLGSSDEASRTMWRESLKRIAALNPRVVVAGHKKSLTDPDSPAVLDSMDRYLANFDSLRATSRTVDQLFQAMKARYPHWVVERLLRSAAEAALATSELAIIREEIAAINKTWSKARLGYDSATVDRLLATDFYAQLAPTQRLTRAEFIPRVVTRVPNERMVRFDKSALTVTRRSGNEWVVVAEEKVEFDREVTGTTEKRYSLRVTRDGYRLEGNRWYLTFSEPIGNQSWSGGAKPPLADWDR